MRAGIGYFCLTTTDLCKCMLSGDEIKDVSPNVFFFLHAAVCSVHVNILGASFMSECSSEEKPLDKA